MKKSILERLEEIVIDYKNYVKSLEKRILELEIQLEKTKNNKNNFFDEIKNYSLDEYCLHKNCSNCKGTGYRKDRLGMCVHNISCNCPRCSFKC